MNLNIVPLKLHPILHIANPKYTGAGTSPVKSEDYTIKDTLPEKFPEAMTRSATARLRNYSYGSGTTSVVSGKPFVAILLIFILSSLAGFSSLHAAGLKLVASVAPQEYLLNQLKTPESKVILVIQPGQNPTTWDPSPRQMLEIVGADIMFPIGVPFENIWLPRLRQRAPNLMFADTMAGIVRLEFNAEAATTEHQHADSGQSNQADHAGHNHIDNTDPHIWLDPLRCITIAQNMTAALQQFDPEHSDFYAAKLQQLTLRLERLHSEITQILAPIEQRTFMVFHPSWGYFAARYNLHQIALEKDGKEPSGAHLVELIEVAARKNIKVIFIQRQFSTRAAQAIANQTGAKIEILDPLASDLPAALRLTADSIARSSAP